MQFAVEYQQFDVLVIPDKKGVKPFFGNIIKSIFLKQEEQERFKQNLALYFAACVLDCCGLPLDSSSGPTAPIALKIEFAAECLNKLRLDFESYMDKANINQPTKHEVAIFYKQCLNSRTVSTVQYLLFKQLK